MANSMILTANSFMIVPILIFVFVIVFYLILIFSCYHKVPADKIMVIYGRVGKDKDGNETSCKCLHGGAAFVWPVIQSYEYLDLTPIPIEVNLKNAVGKENYRVDAFCDFTVVISTEEDIMQNAAERLLGLPHTKIKDLVKDILFGQLRLVIAQMEIDEIRVPDAFLKKAEESIEDQIKQIGLHLIRFNIKDIKVES